MQSNPYDSPMAETSVVTRKRRWRVILPASCFLVLLLFNLFAVSQGVVLHGEVPTFGEIVGIVNFPGVVPWYMFGDPLAHRDDPIHAWNDFLLFAGGTLGWTLIAFIIGLIVDAARQPAATVR